MSLVLLESFLREQRPQRVGAWHGARAAAPHRRNTTQPSLVPCGGRAGRARRLLVTNLPDDPRDLRRVLRLELTEIGARQRLRHPPSVNPIKPTNKLDLHVVQQMAIPPMTSGGSRPVLTGAAARLVGAHPATVRRAIERGELEAYRLGPRGAWRITEEALREWARSAPSPEENL